MTTIPTVDRTDFSVPYKVVTQKPELPVEVAAVLDDKGYGDLEKLQALDLETLGDLFHQARRHYYQHQNDYDTEITWLRRALADAEIAKRHVYTPSNILEAEWTRRRTPENITWQGVRKVLVAAGMVVDDARTKYSRDHLRSKGHLFTTTKTSDTEIEVRVENLAAQNQAQPALEAAGYTIKHRSTPTPGAFLSHTLDVIKLKPGQTLEDVNRDYYPPQKSASTD